MKALIVNAYPATPQGQSSFAKFRQHVMHAIEEVQRVELDKVEILVSRQYLWFQPLLLIIVRVCIETSSICICSN